MPPAKKPDQLKAEGWKFAGLMEYPDIFNLLNRLLKPYGLRVVYYSNYREYGDQIWVKVVKL
jgi:hypothetical protein